MPTITSSVNELRSSLISICFDLFQSLLALFNAILTFGRHIVSAVMNVAQALFRAAVGITGGVAELVWANLFVIAFCVGGYYLYTTYYARQSSGRGRGKKKSGG